MKFVDWHYTLAAIALLPRLSRLPSEENWYSHRSASPQWMYHSIPRLLRFSPPPPSPPQKFLQDIKFPIYFQRSHSAAMAHNKNVAEAQRAWHPPRRMSLAEHKHRFPRRGNRVRFLWETAPRSG